MTARCFKYVGLLIALCAISTSLSCKRLSEEDISGKKKKFNVSIETTEDYSTQEKNLSTGEINYDSGVVTDEASLSLDTYIVVTGETEVSTYEQWDPSEMATEEAMIEDEIIVFVRGRRALLQLKDGTIIERRRFRTGESLRVLRKVLIKARYFEKAAFEVEDLAGNIGFVYEENVCASRVCVDVERWGVIEIYNPRQMEKKKIPQISLSFMNLFESELDELHVKAFFYFKGEEIGQDMGHPVSSVLGKPPLKPGQKAKIFLRPRYWLEEGEEISPDNYIEVKLKCSIRFQSYENCGVFKIDQMFY